MSSCLSGGGRAYGFDLEIVKPPSPSTYSSHSSSPSSTISESSNSPLAISTRKPRTPRKRPNQTYTEAAALLSTIYPSIFSTKHLQKRCKHVKSYDSFSESSELLPPFRTYDNPGFLLHQPIPEKPTFRIAPRPANSGEKSCHGSSDIDFRPNSPAGCDGYEEDFDAGLILDEVDEGIDSIMGNLSMCNESYSDSNDYSGQTNDWCGNPMGLGFGGRFEVGVGFRGNVRALRHVEDEDWWRNPTVEVINILPKFKSSEKKKKKKKVEEDELKDLKSSLCLKLNYEDVLSAWSDRSPFSDQISTATGSTADAIARLSQCDLLSGIGGWKQHQGDEIDGQREACVLRYKEKRRTRLFSKKIRYQVRKVNADRRPRMKGRFVRRPSLLHLSNGEG